MDGGIASSSSPESLAGILKTIFLFLENQNFTETCSVLITECRKKEIPHIKKAPARLVVLRPSIAEIVKIAHADPKNHDIDGQVQPDFPLTFTDKPCALEGSIYEMLETQPSPKHVSLFVTDNKYCVSSDERKIRIASAPILNVKACRCVKEDGVRDRSFERPHEDASSEKTTGEDLIEKSAENDEPSEEALSEKLTEDDLEERAAEDDIIEEATEDVLHERPIEDDVNEKLTEDDLTEKSTKEKSIKQEENIACHTSCTGLCSNKDSTEPTPHEYVIIQQSCPLSCTGYCSGRNVPGLEHISEQDVASRDQQTSPIPIPLDSVEYDNEELNDQDFIEIIDTNTGEIIILSSKVLTEKQDSVEVVSPENADTSRKDDSAIQNNANEILSRSVEITDSEELVKHQRKSAKQGVPKSSTSPLLQSAKKESGTYEEDRAGTSKPEEKVEETLKSIERLTLSDPGKLAESHKPVREHGPTKLKESSASLKEFAEIKLKSPSIDRLEEKISNISSQLVDEGIKQQVESSTFKETLLKRKVGLLYLDYVKLKKHLREGNPKMNRNVLRALRWRLTSAKQETRHNIMIEYSRNDVLGLHNHPSEGHQSIAEELLCPEKGETPNQLQEAMARFVNAMASLMLGREYLCKKQHFLAKVLIPLLFQDNRCSLNDVTRCHLLVTLQKLSLRNKMRKTMILAGVPEYIVSFLLAKHNEISQYCLEYTTALFMNLCLHKETRDQLKLVPDKVIDLIIAFLDSDRDECLPYINGSMYSVFIEPKIRIEAVDRKLEEKIQEKINGKSKEVRQQMEIVQTILKIDPSETYCSECDCLDQDEEIEHLEPELDAGDVLSDPECELILEQFRRPEYCKVFGGYKFNCLRRPVTPLQRTGFSIPCKSCSLGSRLGESLEEVEDEDWTEQKKTKAKRTSGSQSKLSKAGKTVDTLYKADEPDQQESKMEAELDYLLAAKQTITAKQMKATRRVSTKTFPTAKSKGRSQLNTAELNSINFQQKFSREDSTFPCSHTRQCINTQDRMSFRADQAKAFKPCIFYKNYKMCYNTDLPSFSYYTTQTDRSSNRYKCDCFEEMKALIDQLEIENQCCCGCRQNKPNLLSDLAKVEEPEVTVNVQPSYNELLHSLRKNLGVTEYCTSEPNCTVHCECYNLVFRSRPKVTRTP